MQNQTIFKEFFLGAKHIFLCNNWRERGYRENCAKSPAPKKEVDLMISGEQRAGEVRCLRKHFSTSAVAAIKDLLSSHFSLWNKSKVSHYVEGFGRWRPTQVRLRAGLKTGFDFKTLTESVLWKRLYGEFNEGRQKIKVYSFWFGLF